MTKIKEPAVIAKTPNVSMREQLMYKIDRANEELEYFHEKGTRSIRRTARFQIGYGIFSALVGIVYGTMSIDNFHHEWLFYAFVSFIWFGIGYFSFRDGWKDRHYGKRSNHMR